MFRRLVRLACAAAAVAAAVPLLAAPPLAAPQGVEAPRPPAKPASGAAQPAPAPKPAGPAKRSAAETTPGPTRPGARPVPSAAGSAVPKVAFEVCHRINGATPITPMSIVAFSMLGAEGRGLTMDEGRAIGRPIIECIGRRGLPPTSDVRVGEIDPFKDALRALIREGVVREYPGGSESVYAISGEKH